MGFSTGERVRMRSGGPVMTVTEVTIDEEDGEVTVWCARTVDGEAASEYYRPVVLQPADAPAPTLASVRPGGPLPGDVVENPRFGGTMTVSDRDSDDAAIGVRIWAQWFSGEDYGSGSFPLDAAGRVVDYPAKAG